MKNLKKVISSVAAIAIVASSASAFAVTFPDVDSSASYAKAVEVLTALKIVNGDDKGLFNPENNVTRAEFTKMAVGALGEIAAAEAQTTSQFTDAANTSQHWAAGYIAQGVADGFINGMGDAHLLRMNRLHTRRLQRCSFVQLVTKIMQKMQAAGPPVMFHRLHRLE